MIELQDVHKTYDTGTIALNGFQQIGLSLRIFADNQIDAGMKADAGRLVIPKIVELQALQLHACSSVTRQVFCRNVTSSPG